MSESTPLTSETLASTEAEAVARLAAEPVLLSIEGVPHAFLPEGWDVHAFMQLLPTPPRKSGLVEIHDVASFVALTKAQGSLANCRIYLDVDYVANRLTAAAVFNDHGEDEPGWRDHRAVFSPRLSQEWKRWVEHNGKPMDQAKFAEFLEYNLPDIATPRDGEKLPNANDVLAFVTSLQETRTVKYGSAINTMNGMVQLEFTEQGDQGTKGKLEVFRQFALGIRPFLNGEPYRLLAFLRYRIERNSGQILFWFDLQRPESVLEDAAREMVKTIQQDTGLPVVFGKP